MTVLTAAVSGCQPAPMQPSVEFNPISLGECPAEMDQAPEVLVDGTYEYSGHGINEPTGLRFQLSGSVTFEQDGDMVRMIEASYDGLDLRSLTSDFVPLEGNTLMMTAVSNEDGETEETRYVAEIAFIFSDNGDEFCVAYTDSNNDGGEMGSFVGRRM